MSRHPFNWDRYEQINRDIATQWITNDELANQINLFSDESQDAYLNGLELAVRMAIEDYLGLPILPIDYRVYYGTGVLGGSPAEFDLPQVSQNGVTIISVKYYGSDNVLNTVDPASYFYDPTGQRVICTGIPNEISSVMTSPIIVEYTAAASDIGTYPVVKQAGLLLFTHLYNNRSDTTEINLKQIPFGVDRLLRPYKPLVM